MDKKKKKLIIVIAVILVLAVIGLAIWFFKFRGTGSASGKNVVYVDSVANLAGLSSGDGLNGRYSGVVEPQETWKIEVSQDKKIKEIYVEEGQEVKVGDKLFTYDTQDSEDTLNQSQIDLERIQSDIDTANNNIAELEKEKKEAGADEQLSYTTQIQTAQNSVKRSEYEKKTKAVEIENLKKTIANADVLSEIGGVVKSINKDGTATTSTGEAEPFMTVLATGDYRVKGKVNEQNMSSIIEGNPVIIRSRVDEDKTWKGTLTSVETDKPESSQNSMYMSSGSSETSSSNYPFYVILDSADGLMLGQHVYIEMDNGQEDHKDGIWLDSYYLVMDEEKPKEAYVWAADSKDKLEKRKVTLGEFDEDLQKYQITEGLTAEDYIAYPDDTIEAGAPVTRNINDLSGQNDSDVGSDGGAEDLQGGEGVMPGGSMDGGMDAGNGVSGSMDVQEINGSDEGGEAEIAPGDDDGADDAMDENDVEGSVVSPGPVTIEGDGSAPASAGN